MMSSLTRICQVVVLDAGTNKCVPSFLKLANLLGVIESKETLVVLLTAVTEERHWDMCSE